MKVIFVIILGLGLFVSVGLTLNPGWAYTADARLAGQISGALVAFVAAGMLFATRR